MKTLSFDNAQLRHLLLKSLCISLGVHMAALTLFYFNPLLLRNTLTSLFGISSATPEWISYEEEDLELKEMNLELKDVFEQIIVLSPHLTQPFDLTDLPKGMALSPHPESVKETLSTHDDALYAFNTDLSFFSKTPVGTTPTELEAIPPLFSETSPSTPIASQLQIDAKPVFDDISALAVPVQTFEMYEDLIAISETALVAAYETQSPLSTLPFISKRADDLHIKADRKPHSGIVQVSDIIQESDISRPSLFVPRVEELPLQEKEIEMKIGAVDFERYNFPETASAAEWNDDFDANVVFLPNPDGEGYIFSLALSPSDVLSNYSIKHNFYFIIDRSNSVQKHRFAVFKRAVLKALSCMQKTDAFNILIIDKKIARFKPTPLAATMKNIQAAEEFLDKQEAGGLFSAGEIYSLLEKILPSISDDDEMHSAILLTDGKTNLEGERKQKTLKNWVEKNNSRVSLYAGAIGRDNDLLSLDLLCSISGGRLLYSDTHASFPRKLAKLILDLKDPIAKEIMITAIPHNPASHIQFSSASAHLPSLFSHQPYVLYGEIDEPCAFDLVIQGKHRDQWIAIKKTISFINGKKGDQQLENKWKAQQANLCYGKFLEEGKRSHLKEAKDILKKSRTEVAFE